jgi:protoporphyrinogen IX oxidase
MIGFLGGAYPWVVAAHIIFVIFWMAGLFMLPRFFVYHQEAEAGSAEAGRWIEREARLIRIILNPAMIIVWLLGLILATDTGAYTQIWFHLKLLSVVGLSAYHGWMSAYAKRLALGEVAVDGKTLRLLNEVPGIAVTVIVILVIIRPFA